jgi:hypothetical protein
MADGINPAVHAAPSHPSDKPSTENGLRIQSGGGRWMPLLTLAISVLSLSISMATYNREGNYAGEVTLESMTALESTIISGRLIDLDLKNFSKHATKIHVNVYAENLYIRSNDGTGRIDDVSHQMNFREQIVAPSDVAKHRLMVLAQGDWPEYARLMIYVNGYKSADFRYRREGYSADYKFLPANATGQVVTPVPPVFSVTPSPPIAPAKPSRGIHRNDFSKVLPL